MTVASAPSRIDRVSILLVDDQPAKLLTYEAMLADLGEHLITATSATEALQCLLASDVAVVLVDVCMPDLDGYELAAMIRQHPRFQKTSIIFVSALLVGDPDRVRGYECGAVDYVPVPVVPEILRAKVRLFAELYRKTRALERLNAELESRVAERTAELEAKTLALKQADQRKDEFLAMLAHELRNPLAPIRTAVELLRIKELAEADRTHARDVIENQVEHLVTLIDDLLDISRITRGVITLQRQPVLMGAIVARAIETARPAIDSRGHELKLELPVELLTVDGDKTRLVQVVANILSNAAKFTEPGGRIVVRVACEGTQAVLSVTDNGIGVPADFLSSMFDLFTQARGRLERDQGGLGIGLALVRRLTEMHGGTVTARSEGPGRGTEIIVRLPLAGAVRSSVAVPSQQRLAALPSRRVLIADDNRDAATTLAMWLQMAGHDVRVAHDGIEALDVADTFTPEVVLLDLGMPRLDGLATASRMRDRPWRRQATIVALTGWGHQEDRDRSLAAGFDRHLVKPVGEADLFEALQPRVKAAP